MTGSAPNDGVTFLRDGRTGGTCTVTSPPLPQGGGGQLSEVMTLQASFVMRREEETDTRPAGGQTIC